MPIQNEKQRLDANAEEPISVTIDASDLNVASAEPLRGVIARYGRPAVARAFADFQQAGISDLAVQFYQMGLTLIHCPTWPNGDGVPKTVVSDVVAQDLRDQLEELEDDVETFLLVATSRDYIAVVNALRRHDRRVVVVAEEAKVCRELKLCADEFAILPPTRAERAVEGTRVSRYSEAARAERAAEAARAERAAEAARVERAAEAARTERAAEIARAERLAELARAERIVEPARPERAPEPARPERVPEPARPERVPEPARAERVESADSVRLPSDSEVLAEVRRIVAAEGICTPRRLARALCPVDRTATGELRSRIANRIQALVDSGKLLRDRLVVGGTSVETILARDERNGRGTHAAPVEPAPSGAVPSGSAPRVRDLETEPAFDFLTADLVAPSESLLGMSPEEFSGLEVEPRAEEPVGTEPPAVEPAVEPPAAEPPAMELKASEVSAVEVPAVEAVPSEPVRRVGLTGMDLDALVEKVLRTPQLAAGLLSREATPEPAPAAVRAEAAPIKAAPIEAEAAVLVPAEPVAAEPAMAEPVPAEPAPPEPASPKRTRSRRKPAAKAPVAEPNGAA